MARIWNITDHPKTKIKPSVLMVLGRSVRPGKSLNVSDERLKNAHKIHRTVAAGKLFIGPKPPADYLLAKQPERLTLPEGVARSHGVGDLKQVSKEAPAKVDKVLPKEAKSEKTAKTETTEEAPPEEAKADQPQSNEGSSSGRRRGKG